jgi:hypothetical protein
MNELLEVNFFEYFFLWRHKLQMSWRVDVFQYGGDGYQKMQINCRRLLWRAGSCVLVLILKSKAVSF